MVDDKDIDTVMSLLPASAQYYFTRATTQRAIPEQQIKEISLRFKLQGETFPTVAEAYQQALEDADKDDFIFVGGSSYIVADFLSFLHQMKHVHHN
jgi:tetrahydrofolate synthase